jgi:hypothetical protein
VSPASLPRSLGVAYLMVQLARGFEGLLEAQGFFRSDLGLALAGKPWERVNGGTAGAL